MKQNIIGHQNCLVALIVLNVIVLAACNNRESKAVEVTHQDSLRKYITDTNKLAIERQEAIAAPQKLNCKLTNIDTSLANIVIGDASSATAVLGDKNTLDSIGQYHFYSRQGIELLTLTQQPGDYLNQISVFKVAFAGKADHKYRKLPVDFFASSNGLRLGVSEKQINTRLGNCFVRRVDSAKNSVELYYRLSLPDDTETHLLERHNTPIYYARYKLHNDRLVEFEFGFEYP